MHIGGQGLKFGGMFDHIARKAAVESYFMGHGRRPPRDELNAALDRIWVGCMEYEGSPPEPPAGWSKLGEYGATRLGSPLEKPPLDIMPNIIEYFWVESRSAWHGLTSKGDVGLFAKVGATWAYYDVTERNHEIDVPWSFYKTVWEHLEEE